MIWIGYTTRYREGGRYIKRAAETLAKERREEDPFCEIRLDAVETQQMFLDAIDRLRASDQPVREFHFFGHSGFHGPMFGTRAHMEQLSPSEWLDLEIPFAPDGEAFFHACRTARWFAPFFARNFGVPASGYYWYTTFSRRSDCFRPVWRNRDSVYLLGCPGGTSHGRWGTLFKRAGLLSESIRRFHPKDVTIAAASLALDKEREFILETCPAALAWIEERVSTPTKIRVLDVGCGSGRLLKSLDQKLGYGAGVDSCEELIERAQASSHKGLGFYKSDAVFPLPDNSFDLVVSVLAFRYLDWDLAINEMRRVLKPGGRIILLDLVTVPASVRDIVTTPRLRVLSSAAFDPEYADDEFRDYLGERFPGGNYEVLAVNSTTRLVAFDTGPLEPGQVAPLRFP